MKDERFRTSLLPKLEEDVNEYLKNPSCKCNLPIYTRILKHCKKEVKAYFPGREPIDPDEEIRQMSENHWIVINCHVDELEKKLKSLRKGRKQLAITRYEDQVTVVINELDHVF
jgi:hypothetical protein